MAYETIENTEIQAVGKEDKKEKREDKLRISYEKEKGIKTGVSAGLQVDFLELLKLTLLYFDFSRKYSESEKIYLSFNENDIEDIRRGGEVSDEIFHVLQGHRFNFDVLSPFLISRERRRSEKINSKYMVLFFQGRYQENNQYIQRVEKGKVSTFFRHHFSKSKYMKDFLGFLASIFGLDFLATNQAHQNKMVTIEYRSKENLIKRKKKLPISNLDQSGQQEEEKLSIKMGQYHNATEIHGSDKKRFRHHFLRVLESYTKVEQEVIESLERDQFRGPASISTHFVLSEQALKYFNALSENQVERKINILCDDRLGGKRRAMGIHYGFRGPFGFCKYSLKQKAKLYFKELAHEEATASVCSHM